MKHSIIIPTAFDKLPLLKACIGSIKKFTDLNDTEIIVVANGVTDGSADYALEQGCVVIPFEEAIGFPKAVNAGIEAATSDYFIVLNNDVQILGEGWLELLTAPFANSTVGVTGPMKERAEEIDQDFILFFCVCIARKVIDKIGLLDEIFSPGYSEDIDFCARAKRAGFKILQVPDNESHDYYAPNRRQGNFPIYHAGNETFRNFDPSIIHRNHALILERYDGVNIANAQKLGEFVSDPELCWLARQAKKSKIVIELGSWFGKSATVIADNLPEGGVLWCVDTWMGSAAEQSTQGVEAKKLEGDYAFDQFARNLWPHIASGKLRPLRMHGKYAAQLLRDMGIQADMVFIDAGHMKEEVKEDIANYAPLVKPGGVLCGHDYRRVEWPMVTEAVDSMFKEPVECTAGTIWHTTQTPAERDPCAYDCFLFNNELDLLEKRLETMYDAVDRFVIVEATVTHSGKPKPLNFHNNLGRYEKYLNKITYIVVEDSPPFDGTEDGAWKIERFQRDALMRGLNDCKDNDIIIVSDLDEIPNPLVLHSINGNDIASLEMELLLYDGKVRAKDPWYHAKIVTYKKLKEITPCGARYSHEQFDVPKIRNGGQHLSWSGGVDAIIEKIHNTAHRNIDTPQFTDPEHIQRCMDCGLDLFDRDIEYQVCE